MINALAVLGRYGYALLWFVAFVFTIVIWAIFLIPFYIATVCYNLTARQN